MLDIYNPNSLKEKVDVEIAETLSEYFIAYSNQINHIDSIKHMQDSQVIAMHIYGYEGKSISKNTSTYFQSDDLKKCISLIKKKEIETECFNKNGQLISKEYFNKESKYYSFENYDSTGTRVYHEWGKF